MCVLSKHARKHARQLRQQERAHYLFLRAAGSLYNVCVQAWLGRGADKSRGITCNPLNSEYTWAHEAHADEELLRMRRPAAVVRPRSPTVDRVDTVPAAFRMKRLTSGPGCLCRSSVRVMGQRIMRIAWSAVWMGRLSQFWSYAYTENVISVDDGSVSVANAALGGQVQMLHHLLESELCSVFIARPRILRAFYEPGCLMAWNTGLLRSTWSWRCSALHQIRQDAKACKPRRSVVPTGKRWRPAPSLSVPWVERRIP